jgi:hypothetical protein
MDTRSLADGRGYRKSIKWAPAIGTLMLLVAGVPAHAAAGPFDVIFTRPAGVWNTYGSVGAAIHKDGKFVLFTCSPDLGFAGSFGFASRFARSFEGQTRYGVRASMDRGSAVSDVVEVEGSDLLTGVTEVNIDMPAFIAVAFTQIFSKANSQVEITISPGPNKADPISTVFSAKGATKALQPLLKACSK